MGAPCSALLCGAERQSKDGRGGDWGSARVWGGWKVCGGWGFMAGDLVTLARLGR